MLLIYSAHIIICVLVILIILFQDGKTGGLTGVADNASQQVFGAKGAGSFLTKLTTGLAIAFMVTSLTLAFFHRSDDHSIADDYTPVTSDSESSQVKPTNQPEGQQTEPPAATQSEGGVVIKGEDGTEKTENLADHVEGIDIVPFDEAPESLKEAHKADLKKAEEAKKAAKEKGNKKGN